MLILDKSRALDMMVAQASRAPLPEEYSLDGEPASVRGGFRVAVYGPIGVGSALRPSWNLEEAPTILARSLGAPITTPAR